MKNIWKRLAGMLVTACMVMAMVPALPAAAADTEITHVELPTDYPAIMAGTFHSDYTYTMDTSSSNYTTTFQASGATVKSVLGYNSTITATLTANDGYVFSASPSNLYWKRTSLSNGNKTAIFTRDLHVDPKSTINAISLSGIASPEPGQTPAAAQSVIASGDGDLSLTVADINDEYTFRWVGDLDPNNKFKEGVAYELCVPLYSGSNNSISPSATVTNATVNGVTPSVIFPQTNMTHKTYAVLSYQFPGIVSSVQIDNVAPVAGEKPTTTITNSSYRATIAWDPPVDADESFLNDTVYTATIELTAVGGVTFSDNIVNGNHSLDGETPAASKIIRNSDTSVTVTHSFSKTASVVSSIRFNDVAPVAGKNPTEKISNEGYQAVFTWNPPVNGNFLNDTVYTATIEVTAQKDKDTNQAYEFSDDIVDGNISLDGVILSAGEGIRKSKTKVEITHTFPKTASVVPPVVPPVTTIPSATSTPYIPPVTVPADTASGSTTGAKIEMQASQLPSGVEAKDVTFVAKAVETATAPAQAVSAPAKLASTTLASIPNLPTAKSITVFDLDLLLKSSGEKVDFSGKVIVSIPMPAGYGSFLRVFHVANDGTMTEVPAVISGSNILLTLEHFSHYAVVDFASPAGKLPTKLTASAAVTTAATTAKPSEGGNNAGKNPTTGAMLPLLAILGCVGAGTLAVKARKRK